MKGLSCTYIRLFSETKIQLNLSFDLYDGNYHLGCRLSYGGGLWANAAVVYTILPIFGHKGERDG